MKVRPVRSVSTAWRFRAVWLPACFLICWALAGSASGQSGSLETMRDDVRSARQPSKFSLFKWADPEPRKHHGCHDNRGYHGVEAFAGYEYLDLDRMQTGGLIAGLRFWF